MRLMLIFLLLVGLDARSQTAEDSVRSAVSGLFKAMYDADAAALRTFVSDTARMETLSTQADGTVVLYPMLAPSRRRERRLDLLVDRRVVIDFKSTERPAAVHARQLLTYLRLADYPLGMLLNFHSVKLMDACVRMVNNL